MNEAKLRSFEGKKILGIDYGKRVTGLAYFCPGEDFEPFAYGKIVVINELQALQEIKKIAHKESIEIIIFGIPYLLDGKATSQSKELERVGKELQKMLPHIQFYFQDETLSTFEATDRMKNSPRYNFEVDMKLIDSLSAAIIIEGFFKY